MTVSTRTGDVAEGLSALIHHEVPGVRDVDLEGLRRTSSGFSRENWVFDAHWRDGDGDHALPLILRRDPAGSLLNTDRVREFTVLRALEATKVPVPAVHWLDSDGQWLGSPSLVMERVAGSCDWFVLNGTRPLPARLRLAHEFLALLAEIQRVDWRGAGLGDVLGDPGPEPARVELERWADELRRVQLEPLPEMELVLSWLQESATAASDVVLVHGDFKPGNALLDGDEIRVMLDWETAHLGDPLEDLGWVTSPVRHREHQIPDAWEREQIVAAYTSLTGRDVAEAQLRWWNVFSCWKLAVINLAGLAEFVADRFDRVHQTPAWLFRRMFRLIEASA